MLLLLLAAAVGVPRPDAALAVGADGALQVAQPSARLEAMLETTRRLLAHARVQGAPPTMHTILELERAHQADQDRDASDPHDVAGVYASSVENPGVGQERNLQEWKVVVCGTHDLLGDGETVPATRLRCTQPLGLHFADQMMMDHWREKSHHGHGHGHAGMIERVLTSANHAKDLVLATPLQAALGPRLVVFFEPARQVDDLEPLQPGLATIRKLTAMVASPGELLQLFDGEPRGFEGVFLNSREGKPVAQYRDAMVVAYGGQGPPTSALQVGEKATTGKTAAAATATAKATATATANVEEQELARERLEDQREELEDEREKAVQLRRRETADAEREAAERKLERGLREQPDGGLAYLDKAWGLDHGERTADDLVLQGHGQVKSADDILARELKHDEARAAKHHVVHHQRHEAYEHAEVNVEAHPKHHSHHGHHSHHHHKN